MYEVITDLVDELVANLPDDARAQFERFVEAVALTPLAGFFLNPEAPGEFPTLLWPLQTRARLRRGPLHRLSPPEDVVLDPSRALESDRVVIDDVIWIS